MNEQDDPPVYLCRIQEEIHRRQEADEGATQPGQETATDSVDTPLAETEASPPGAT